MSETKLDVAKHHIITSLQLLAIPAHPFSIHLVTMAASELVEDVARDRRVTLPYDPEMFIKPEFVGDYQRLRRKQVNFFKHADRDAHAIYDGPPPEQIDSLNRVLTFLSIIGLSSLGEECPPIFGQFQMLVGLYNPRYINWEEVRKINPSINHTDLPKMALSEFNVLLRAILANHGFGLPATVAVTVPNNS